MKKGALMTVVFLLMVISSREIRGEMKQFRGIAFRGLKNLSKYELIQGIPVKSVKGTIYLDVTALEKRLSSMALISSFRITKDKGTLVVEVAETEALLPLAVENGAETVFLEIDENFKILARNRFLGGRRPVIYCNRRDVEGEDYSARLQKLLRYMLIIRNNRKILFREISSLSFHREGKIVVKLRERNTRFVLTVDLTNFRRLEAVAGYCDTEGVYPDKVIITGNKVVLR